MQRMQVVRSWCDCHGVAPMNGLFLTIVREDKDCRPAQTRGNMFALLAKLSAEEVVEELGNGLVKTLNSFHLIQFAVHKEECDGYRGSVPVLSC
jgi:hypothetical protein